MSADLPKGIQALAATLSNTYALLLLLDGLPYVDQIGRAHV